MSMGPLALRIGVVALAATAVVGGVVAAKSWGPDGPRRGDARPAWRGTRVSPEVLEVLRKLDAASRDGSADTVPLLRRIDAGAPGTIAEVWAVLSREYHELNLAAALVLEALPHRTTPWLLDELPTASPAEERRILSWLHLLVDWWDVPSRRGRLLDAIVVGLETPDGRTHGGELLVRRVQTLVLADEWRPEFEALVRERLPTAEDVELEALLGLLACSRGAASHVAPLVVTRRASVADDSFSWIDTLTAVGPPDREFVEEVTTPLREGGVLPSAHDEARALLSGWARLASADDTVVIPWLVSAAREGAPAEREAAIRALQWAAVAHAESVRAVLGELVEESSPDVRKQAEAALAEFESRFESAGERVAPDALAKTRALNEAQLQRIVGASGLRGRSVGELRHALRSDDPDVRVAAAHLLHVETGEVDAALDVLRWELRSTQWGGGFAGALPVSFFNPTELRWLAVAEALERMGPAARAAADDLLAAAGRTPQGLLAKCVLTPLPRIALGDPDVIAALRGRDRRYDLVRSGDAFGYWGGDTWGIDDWGTLGVVSDLVERE